MALKKIRQKAWMYTLYESDGSYILSVVCGGVAMYELNIPLSPDEASKAVSDEAFVETLAKNIASNPHQYAPKSVFI